MATLYSALFSLIACALLIKRYFIFELWINMKPKFLLMTAIIVLPLLYWLSNNAAEFVLANDGQAKPLSTNACMFGQDVCEVSLPKESYLVSVVNDFSGGQAIQLQIEPKLIKNVSSKALQGIHFLLQGKTMYMGISETELQLVNGKWVGLLRIPFCTTKVMQWQLDMTMTDASGEKYQARYEFEMKHG